jgi:hypothetical protein
LKPKSLAASMSAGFARYCDILQAYSDLIGQTGLAIVPFHEGRESRFESLEPGVQTQLIADLELQVKILHAGLNEGIAPYDDRRMAWWALRSFGFQPGSDTFEKIDFTDVIEIYNRDHKQIFRSLNFFRFLSYSLDEICTFQWWELYGRDADITARMIEVSQGLISGTLGVTVDYGGIHWVDEKFSERGFRTQIEPRMAAPLLFADGSGLVGGYLNVFRVIQTLPLRADV